MHPPSVNLPRTEVAPRSLTALRRTSHPGLQEASTTDTDRPELCACYFEGYARGKAARIGVLLNMMASRFPELVDPVRAWALDDHDG